MLESCMLNAVPVFLSQVLCSLSCVLLHECIPLNVSWIKTAKCHLSAWVKSVIPVLLRPVQVTSKLTFVGDGALSQPTKAMDLFLFFLPPPPPALQIIPYIMYGLTVAVWFTCEMLSGSCV